jgi:wobble nucleotide-excising tRNase
MIFADIRKQLESLEKEIKNKELSLDRLKKCLSTLEKAA